MARKMMAVGAVVAMSFGALTTAGASAAPPTRESYIVVLRPGTPDVAAVAASLARAYGGQVGHVYQHALAGFSVSVSAQGAAGLARRPEVAFVEADRLYSLEADAQATPTGIMRIGAAANASIGINGSDDDRVDVDVAVIDTGIDWQHPELNVVNGINCASGSPTAAKCSGNGDDDHYHGTHVAGTIGALDDSVGVVGVAPGARLWAVKVLNSKGSGYTSWIVAGIDWVAAHATEIEVANMSLGGSGYSQAQYTAIQGAVNKGVAFAVAAGNSDADALNYSPAAFNNVLSVSALADFDGVGGGVGSATCRADVDDTLADFSNWGTAVDIAAPGVCISSTYPVEKGSYGTISGTSMASPHVAGALALMASSARATDSSGVAAMYASLVSMGTDDWTDDSGDGVKEPLLNVASIVPKMVAGSGGGGGPVNQLPTAGFTQSCTDLACTFTDTSTDADGTINSRAWAFGDGGTSTATNPSHSYVAAGSYTVTLTVTDNAGATATTSRSVSVTAAPEPGTIVLTASARKVRSTKYADLSWTVATSVDVYRNGAQIATGATGSTYTDASVAKNVVSATYFVCSAGTNTCSAPVTVTW